MKNNKKSKVKIKKAGIADIKPFLPLFKDSVKKQFPEYSSKVKNLFLNKYFTRKNFIEDLKKRMMDLILAFMDGQIVGYLMILPPYGGISYVSWLAVGNSFQEKGIGTALLKECEKIIRKRGAHKIHLWTSKRNVKFYKKNGWVLVGNIPENYFGADDWLFYKAIKKPRY